MALAAGLSVFVGVALGLLGGGGTILMLPLLVYVAGVSPRAGVTMSLFAVGATSLVALIPHAQAGRVRWRAGLLFGGAGVSGAYVGTLLSQWTPAWATLSGFGLLMLWTASRMLRCSDAAVVEAPAPTHSVWKALTRGALVGVLAGLTGAGGGFLVVPALILFGGLTMRDAIGTSLLVIAMQCGAAFALHVLQRADIHWALAVVTTLAAIVGSLIGSRLSSRVPHAMLRRGFAWLVLSLGVFVLGAQVWPTLGT